MAAQDLHEVVFEWPHPEPTAVIVTGTFDEWSCSVPLTKTPTGFVGTTKIPWGEKIKFKYVVDGRWVLHENQSTETDPGGFVNHVYTAPPAPPAEETPSTALNPEQPADSEVADNAEPVKDDESVVNGHAENGDAAIAEPAEAPADATVETPATEAAKAENNSDSEPKASAVYPAGYPQFLSDIADTIAARDGTSSTLDYVKSGLGAAIHSVVGVDPINTQQIAIPTPKPDDAFTAPGGPESAPNSAALPAESTSAPTVNPEVPDPLPSPVAPIVPILIVPVNAAENNTVAPESEPVASPPVTVTEVMAPTEAAPEATVAPVAEAAKAAEEASITEPTVSDAPSTVESEIKASTESPPVISDTPTEPTILKDETIEAAPVIPEEAITPAPEPASTASVSPVVAKTAPVSESKPVVESKVEEVPKEPEIVAVVEEPIANVKTEDASTAEPEAPPATTVEETPVEVSAPAPVPTHDGDDLVAEVRAEALAQIPAEPVEVKGDHEELVAEAVAPGTEPVQEELVTPKLEGSSAQPEPVTVTQALKDEEQTPVPEPTVVAVETATVSSETSATETEAVFVGAVVEELPSKEEPAVPEYLVEDVPAKVEETAAPYSNGESANTSKTEEPSIVEGAATVAVEEPPSEVPAVGELVAEVKAEEVPENAIIPAAEGPTIEIKGEPIGNPDEKITTEPVSNSVSEPTPAVVVPQSLVTVKDKAPEEPTTVSEVSQVITETPTSQPVEKAEAVQSILEPEPVVKATTEAAASETAPTTESTTAAERTPAVEPTPAVVPATATEPSVVKPIPIASELSTDSTAGQPSSNGHATSVTAEPTTPSKEKKTFPSSSDSAAASADNSPSSSKFSTMRKKRTSILGKLKHIFHSDKEKEKEKK